MNCAFDKEKLTGYYDGELSASEKAEVERHIASCSECLRDLGELKSAALLVKELPRLRAPRSIAEGVSREIRAAGKLHSMAGFRRLVLWSAAAAAGVFIVANAVYLTSQKSWRPMPAQMPVARAKPAPEPPPQAAEEHAAAQFGAQAKDADRGSEQDKAGRRQLESRKDLAVEKSAAAPAPTENAKKVDGLRERSEAPPPAAAAIPKPQAEELGRAELKSAAPGAAPAPAAQAKPAAPPAPAEGFKQDSAPLAEKEKPAKESEELRKSDGDAKGKVAAAPPTTAPTAADALPPLPPVQINILAKDLSKMRPRIEESLKKLGLSALTPAPQPTRQPRAREAENTIVVELTDVQLQHLREDLEKPGDARMVAASSVEPGLPLFRGSGLFAKKEAPAGGKAAGAAAKEKDVREPDEAGAAKAPVDPAAGPRRKVTLHLVESNKIPPAEGDAVPPQKN